MPFCRILPSVTFLKMFKTDRSGKIASATAQVDGHGFRFEFLALSGIKASARKKTNHRTCIDEYKQFSASRHLIPET